VFIVSISIVAVDRYMYLPSGDRVASQKVDSYTQSISLDACEGCAAPLIFSWCRRRRCSYAANDLWRVCCLFIASVTFCAMLFLLARVSLCTSTHDAFNRPLPLRDLNGCNNTRSVTASLVKT